MTTRYHSESFYPLALYLEIPEPHVLPLDVQPLREELRDLAYCRPPAEGGIVRVVPVTIVTNQETAKRLRNSTNSNRGLYVNGDTG